MDHNKETEHEVEIKYLDDELSEDELKQMDEDTFLDGGPEVIPNWSKHYKADK